MESRLRYINEHLSNYDPALSAERDAQGVIRVFRKAPIMKYFEYKGMRFGALSDQKQHIISLTEDWTMTAKPVEWGIEPLMRKISALDAWRDDSGYENFVKRRQRAEADEARMKRNDIRALAADMRTDFAKATNDIVVRK